MIVHIEAGPAGPIELATSGARKANLNAAVLNALPATSNAASTLPQVAKVIDKRGDVGCELIHELPSQLRDY